MYIHTIGYLNRASQTNLFQQASVCFAMGFPPEYYKNSKINTSNTANSNTTTAVIRGDSGYNDNNASSLHAQLNMNNLALSGHISNASQQDLAFYKGIYIYLYE